MTMPSFPDAPPLLTDDDVLERVQALIGPASAVRTLWLLLLDGDRRQTPVVMPIDDVPPRPDDGLVGGLGKVLTGTVSDLATDAGPGSVVLVLERRGGEHVTPEDREWAAALAAMCLRVDVVLRGVYRNTRRGVRRLG